MYIDNLTKIQKNPYLVEQVNSIPLQSDLYKKPQSILFYKVRTQKRDVSKKSLLEKYIGKNLDVSI